jgi:hypothetical protein
MSRNSFLRLKSSERFCEIEYLVEVGLIGWRVVFIVKISRGFFRLLECCIFDKQIIK